MVPRWELESPCALGVADSQGLGMVDNGGLGHAGPLVLADSAPISHLTS